MNVRGWWSRHFLGAEFAASIFLTAFFFIWLDRWNGIQMMNSINFDKRSAFYGTTASIFGSLLGFVITAISIITALGDSPKLAILKQSEHYPTLWKIFMSSARHLGLATLIMLVALIADQNPSSPAWLLTAVFYSIVISTIRIARCVWALENVIELTMTRQ